MKLLKSVENDVDAYFNNVIRTAHCLGRNEAITVPTLLIVGNDAETADKDLVFVFTTLFTGMTRTGKSHL